jgi:hypothetical protein
VARRSCGTLVLHRAADADPAVADRTEHDRQE